MIWQSSKKIYSKSLTLDTKSRQQCRVRDQVYYHSIDSIRSKRDKSLLTTTLHKPLPGWQFFLRVRSRPISARKWKVAGKYLKLFSEILRVKLTAGKGFCEDLSCQKTRVGDRGEFKRALDDTTGIGSTVRSCCKKRFEKKKNLAKDAKILWQCRDSIRKQVRPSCRKTFRVRFVFVWFGERNEI